MTRATDPVAGHAGTSAGMAAAAGVDDGGAAVGAAASGGAGAGTPPPAGTTPSGGGPPVRMVAVLVAVATLLLGAAAVVASRGGGSTTTAGDEATTEAAPDGGRWHGALLGEPQPRPDFTLTDTEGRPYGFAAETQGRLTLLFFGYTSCPDICPIHMATLSAALDQPGMPDPTVVFVTTDPARDTPERLREWLDKFDTGFVGLHGTPEEIRAAEEAAQVLPSMITTDDGAPPAPGDAYEVGHAAQLIAYTPDDLAHVVYPSGVRRQDWEADLPRLMATWGRPGDPASGGPSEAAGTVDVPLDIVDRDEAAERAGDHAGGRHR